ncbi:ribosomal protein S12 methylthiotransferase [Treponema ruminis]|uniref:Ribosomal protein uS12 methylthiotransferase RimO n=1 Tax=Treponema ruminis TaxID=744515 RepID=A0A7W8LM46_9SPIR|nr:30S ribosomal protein S12 methylthiotransferase RimO [Treponema ruminis]MBB5226112.1 ribosomal protein S12 methylthiotransferase [Treponema ruminis]
MKFFIDQHGCAKNQVDGELIISLLKKQDWEQTFEPAEADLIVVNSCGFIESAKTESINAVMSARQMYPKAKILLAGCLAERYAKDLKDDLLEADGFFGNGDLSQIYKVIEPLMKDERPVLVPEQKGVCCGDRNLLLSFKGTAFVKITEGCNNRCSFCAIPIIRGNLRSRKATEIIEEIKDLVSKGVYEINLIGQDLAAYGTGAEDDCFGDGRTFLPNGTPGSEVGESPSTLGESGLARLIRMISQIEGTFAVRLLYIHPDHFNEDILPLMKVDSRFLHYFDIPFQNGDDAIIKAMNRVGSAQKYKALIAKIRETFPDAAIRTTFMAGFPGETEESFENTKAFLRETATDWSGCFSYSKEDDTPAYSFKKQVPHKTAERRATELVEIQAQITRERLKARVGIETDILIEEVLSQSEENPDEGLAIGRAWFQAPEVDGSVVVRYDRSSDSEKNAVQSGRLVRVKIISSGDVDLNGDFVCDSPLNEKISKSDAISFAQEI